MITLICHQNSPRLSYIVSYLTERLGIGISIHEDLNTNFDANDVIINYTNQAIQSSFSVYNEGLLFEQDLRKRDAFPKLTRVEDRAQLFPSEFDRYNINFDIFSAIFFCLSRYEEYIPFQADEHGRFTAYHSHAYKNDYLNIPVVDVWIELLRNRLNAEFKLNLKPRRSFNIKPTIDVDSAWAFQNRSRSHRISSFIKNLITLNWSSLKTKQQSKKENKDPYDTFEYLKESLEHLNSIFFFLMNFKRPFDTAHYIDQPAFVSLISYVQGFSEIGIHPSYESYDHTSRVDIEKGKLENLMSNKIKKSRQHFLRLNFPSTYETLIANGIQEDYSLGYADAIGFRAGTSLPFKFYNLKSEQSSELVIHPFCIMDVSLKNYHNYTVNEALEEVKKMRKRIKGTNGCLNFIWHNSSFAEFEGWAGWEKVFEELLKT